MSQYVIPGLFTLFVWWFSTGVVLFLNRLPSSTHRWSMLGATGLLGVSLLGLASSSTDASPAGAYLAFTYAVLVWGWLEISYFMGILTGPQKSGCPEGSGAWRRFFLGIQASLYHEIAVLLAAALIVAVTRDGANHVGMWTFMVLWWMRWSAKLNLFFGVPNLNEEFLPEDLRFLRSFVSKRPMNLLFPVSVTVATVFVTLLVQAALNPAATEFQVAGFMLVATLLALALLEHWFLVLPLPDAALWRWALRSGDRCKLFGVESMANCLVSGRAPPPARKPLHPTPEQP